ncbi:MAG: hypothetical protein Phyf2KO_07850 [Phycisphaerales bacterium]
MANRRTNLKLAGDPATRVPTGGSYQPDKLAYDIPDDLPPEPFEDTDGGKLAKRLIIAFVLIAATAVLNFVVLRRYEMDLHPVVLLGSFGVILIASILPAIESGMTKESQEQEPIDNSCAVGCCQGPRPIGELSRKAAARRNQMRLSSRQSKP